MATITLTGISNEPQLIVLYADIDYNGTVYKWTTKTESEVNPQTFLETNLNTYLAQIDEYLAKTLYQKEPELNEYGMFIGMKDSTTPMTNQEKVDVLCGVNELARQMRSIRNIKLTSSDWTQMPDVPLNETQKQAWATYRQSLRDVPEQPDFPQNITWPSQP